MKRRPGLVLSIDQGTTGSRAIVFRRDGRIVSQAYREFRQHYPRPGWVEHDPNEILESVRAVVRAAGSRAGWKNIGAIGITNQRETFVLWDVKTGRPVHRAIVWQCRRTAEFCAKLKARGIEPEVRQRTGLVIDPYFSGTKIRWMLDHIPGLRRRVSSGRILFGTIDSWLLWHLTGGIHATDFTNASRTLLFNIRARRWDPALLKYLGVPETLRLPNVLNSAGDFGRTRKQSGIPAGIPVTGICGDQQAALFGRGAVTRGEIKNTYGTGCFLVLHTGARPVPPKNGLLATIACDARGGPAYALEGAVFIAGAAIQWLRDEIKIIGSSAESEKIARSVPDSGGVQVVPAFTGLGAPYWRPNARGAIFGLTRGSSRAHIVRATLESIAFQTAEVFEAMRSVCAGRTPPIHIRSLNVDGGAARNDLLIQTQADLLGIPIVRPDRVESTAWGAAKLAGIGAGIWPARGDTQVRRRTFRPKISRKRAGEKMSLWRDCVQRLF